MKTLIAALILALALPAHAKTTEKECKAKVQAQIDRLDKRKSRGYSSAEGEELRKITRKLSDARRACGKDPEAWKDVQYLY